MASHYEKLIPESSKAYKDNGNTTGSYRWKANVWKESLDQTDSDSDSSSSGQYGSTDVKSIDESDTSSESSESSIVWLPHIEPDGRLFYTDVVSERYLTKKDEKESVTARARLKKLLKRRRKKKKVKYEDTEFSVLVEVIPVRNRKLSNYCQEYLGIISEFISSGIPNTRSRITASEPVIVSDLVVGSKLAKEGKIRQGDILKSIGKYPVDHSNIELVLQQLVEPCVLPLSIVRKSGLILDVFDTQTMRRYTDEGILGFLEFLESCETSLNIFIDYLEKYSCACLLLSVDDVTELSPEYADIFYEFDLYKFFGGKKRETDATTIRGSVLTVGKSFMELFGEKEQCISINIKDVPHIIVQQAWKTHTFVMAMPSNWTSEHYLHSKLSHIKKLLKFMYGSAESALQFEKEECDWLFTVMFLSVAAVKFCNDCNFSVSKLPCCLLDDMEVTFLEESFPVTTPIPKLLKAQLDAVLCNLEACDVSRMVTSDFENDYVIIRGALIMYKNHLLCTHLPLSITQDIYNYLNLHRILSVVRHSQVFQIVVWSEVFLGEEPFQNKEPTADNLKWSLLVVVQDHITVCAIFETGSNDEKVDKLYLEPAMVEELELVLNEIEKAGVINFLEKWFREPEYSGCEFTQKDMFEPLTRKGSSHSVTSMVSTGEIMKDRRNSGIPKKVFEEESSFSDLSILSDASSKDGTIGSLAERKALQIIIEEKKKLSYSVGPSVFTTFFALDYGRGIVLGSSEYRSEPLNSCLLDRIKDVCFLIKEEFDSANEQSDIAQSTSPREIGRLFTMLLPSEKKKSKKEVSFWVTGRLLKRQCRTLAFVCYEDGTPEDIVEAGLKLAFAM
ncbi:protein inturned-like [Artemia franciscana]|uniref:CCZ1/INTU second Longin domain-containing protein n=2 Tax=Artemia franciscana TaxID=6661 RepID=A0AA88HSA5_ARTSF|nr:hypothetical protein QYM36_011361 [Artemia franciscana]KAK2712645.1 hypothetical protein QYM36_011361 [Artemia franciscana]KAK2712647.1 hypothetical protein QYM36_011361 [Artemia franciscana]